jgi:hypothetical protein
MIGIILGIGLLVLIILVLKMFYTVDEEEMSSIDSDKFIQDSCRGPHSLEKILEKIFCNEIQGNVIDRHLVEYF